MIIPQSPWIIHPNLAQEMLIAITPIHALLSKGRYVDL